MKEKVNKEFISREDSEMILFKLYNNLRYKSLFGNQVNMYLTLSNEQASIPRLQINAIDENDVDYTIEVEARVYGSSIVNGYTAKITTNVEDPFNSLEFEKKWKFDTLLMSDEQDFVTNKLCDELTEFVESSKHYKLNVKYEDIMPLKS